jgi:hypothetical protein
VPDLLTRRQLVKYLTTNGFKISFGTLNRLCAPACNEGPPLDGVWSGRAYYDPGRALAWARARFDKAELRRSRREADRDWAVEAMTADNSASR